jgi:site-specific DNA recombinase
MGFMGKAKAGSLPNKVPYGYRITRTLEGSKVKRTVAINEEDASRVRFIFGSYAKGLGAHRIVREMNRRGWPSPKGNQWTVAAIRYILANPTYTEKCTGAGGTANTRRQRNGGAVEK